METDEENKLLKSFFYNFLSRQISISIKCQKEIRKALFMSISSNGEYLNWLFPSAF